MADISIHGSQNIYLRTLFTKGGGVLTKVLLSWSGPRSKALAAALRDWLPNVIQSVDPWMSESDIDIGSRWGQDLDKELEKASFGILCLTPECISSPWIHYEAGALSKFVDKSRVCPYLLDLQPTDIKGPLVNFHMAKADKDGTLKLVQTINRALSDRPLSEDQLSTSFEAFWPRMEATLAAIPHEIQEPKDSPRPMEDMVVEILKTVREQASISSDVLRRLDYITISEGKNSINPSKYITTKSSEPSIREIFNNDFMKRYTNYRSFDEMMADAVGFMGLNRDEGIRLNSPEFSEFIAKRTDFKDWEHIKRLASYQYRLDFI